MATQNLIQIKRSANTASPTSLANGELAFSGNGDVLYIGNFGSVLAIGGGRTPGTLTANQAIVVDGDKKIDEIITTSLTVETEVSANGSVGNAGEILVSGGSGANAYWAASPSGSLEGLSDTDLTGSTNGSIIIYNDGTWLDQEISGDATLGTDGALTLADTAVTAGSYGDANTVATFTVDSKGRLTEAGNTDIDHDALLNFVANEHINHSDVSITAGDGLTGGGNITDTRTLSVEASNNTISVSENGIAVNEGNLSIDSTQITGDIALGTGTSGNYVQSISGTDNEIEVTGSGSEGASVTIGLPDNVSIAGNMTVAGDLLVSGTTTTINTTQLTVEDNMIGLASNNAVDDIIDFGFYGQYEGTSNTEYSGLIRDASDSGTWKLLTEITTEPTGGTFTGGTLAPLDVGALSASELSLGSALTVENGGTGATTFTENGIVYGSNTDALSVTDAGTQYQVLQAGSGGVPEWGSLDGGTF